MDVIARVRYILAKGKRVPLSRGHNTHLPVAVAQRATLHGVHMGLPLEIKLVDGNRWQADRKPPIIHPSLVSAFTTEWPAGYYRENEPEEHWGWTLDMFMEPGVEMKVAKGPWQKRRPFSLVLHAPSVPFWYRIAQGKKALRGCYISLRETDQTGLECFVTKRRSFAEFDDPDRILTGHMLGIIDIAARHGDRGYLEAHSIFMQLLSALFAAKRFGDGHYGTQNLYCAKSGGPFVDAIRTYMEQHVAEPITLEDVARHMKVSPSALSHRYRVDAGEAPMKTLNRIRVWTARQWLLRGRTQEEAAALTGFCDTSHLARRFRQIEGMSPGDFLRRQGPPEAVELLRKYFPQ